MVLFEIPVIKFLKIHTPILWNILKINYLYLMFLCKSSGIFFVSQRDKLITFSEKIGNLWASIFNTNLE